MTSEPSAELEYLRDLSDGMRNDGDRDGANKVDSVVSSLDACRAELAAAHQEKLQLTAERDMARGLNSQREATARAERADRVSAQNRTVQALDELAAATAREAKLRDALRESLVYASAYRSGPWRDLEVWLNKARALLAEPDTTLDGPVCSFCGGTPMRAFYKDKHVCRRCQAILEEVWPLGMPEPDTTSGEET